MIVHKLNKMKRALCPSILVILLIVSFVGPLILFTEKVEGAPTRLTSKWTRTGTPGGGEGMVIGDVNNDGIQEVIYAGASRCVALKGTDGSTVWDVAVSGAQDTTQPQLADLDKDGYLEVVVPILGPPSGFYILDGRAGSIEQQVSISNARCDNGPVIAALNPGDYPTLFFASMSLVESQEDSNSGGRLRSYKYSGGSPRYQMMNEIRIWHPCSGGLAIDDADHDGELELYMNDRNMGMDRGYGGGAISFWARNLTERWRVPDLLLSSHKPMLADVNKDGIDEVIVTPQRGGLAVLSSKDGTAIRKDQTLYGQGNQRISGHYQSSVYDIDHDGNLEILMADGSHTITNDTVIWDLVTWQEDARIPGRICGQNYFGPKVGEVTGDGVMDIVAANYTAVLVYDGSHNPSSDHTYPLVSGAFGLRSRLMFPVIQDIDNDGYNEIVVPSQGGAIYAFDTSGHVSNPPPRTELEFNSERRLGVAEYVPTLFNGPQPILYSPSPADTSMTVPISTNQLSFSIKDYQGSRMTYYWSTTPNIGSGSSGGTVPDGRYTVSINPLSYATAYKWTVRVTDGTYWTNKTYWFRTVTSPVSNNPPTQGNPLLQSSTGGTGSSSTFLAYNQSTSDPNNGNKVTNTYHWFKSDVSTSNLLMPFNTANATNVKDYSGYNNNGKIVGNVTWTNNGAVGGAYAFNGGYITIPDSNTLDGNNLWYEMSAEAWIYLASNQRGTRFMFKQPCYQMGFRDSGNNRLFAGIWTLTLDTSVNYTSYTQSYIEASYSTSLATNVWYHVAFTYKYKEGVRLYVNGVLVGSAPQSATDFGYIQRSTRPLQLGWFDYFKGKLDELMIFPKCLSPQQIFQDFNQSRNGLNIYSAIVPGETKGGDRLRCEVIPSDSMADGAIKASNTITVANSVPAASNLKIGPRTRHLALDAENLIGNYTYSDIDGNPESGSQVTWYYYRSGSWHTSAITSLTVPASSTSINDVWYFTIHPSDGSEFGDLQTSYNVSIIANSAPQQGVPSLVSSAGTNRDDEDLIARNQTTVDSDGNAVTNVYHWFRNDVSITNLLMSFDTESSTSVKDYSGRNNNGAITGATWTPNGISGGAYSFDGTDVITVPDSTTLDGNGAWTQMTIEFWINVPSMLTGTRIIDKRNPSGNSQIYYVGFQSTPTPPATGNQLFWGVNAGGDFEEVVADPSTALEPGKWYHVVCTYQSGPGLAIFLNGKKIAGLALSGAITPTTPLTGDEPLFIGSDGGTSANRFLIGSLDEVRIYVRALTPAQVFQRYVETMYGQGKSSTIAAQETVSGETWKCEVIPNDSFTDGTARTSNTITILPPPPNSRPRINWYSPVSGNLQVNESSSLNFAQVSSDPNSDALTYRWLLDSVQKSTAQNWTYFASSAIQHTVRVEVSDGSLTDFQEWIVNVIPGPGYSLMIGVTGSGTTDPSAGSHQYNPNTVVVVTAYPLSNWRFDHWVLDSINVGVGNPYSVTMNSSHTLTAVFVIIQRKLTVVIDGSGSTVPSAGNHTYTNGTVVPVQATSIGNWTFDYWMLDGFNVGSTNPYSVTMDANKTLTAYFKAIPQYWLSIAINGSGTTNPTAGNHSYLNNTFASVSATSAANWTLSNWILDGGNIGPGMIFINMISNHTLTAVFAPIPQYKLKIDVVGSGTTNPAVGDYIYLKNTLVSVNAIPDFGWRLDHWEVDNVPQGANNPYVITINANHSLTAVFIPIPQYKLTIVATGNGVTNPASGDYVYYEGTPVSVDATPDANWRLDHWVFDGVNKSAVNPYNVTMDSNHTLEAVFVAKPWYQLTIGVVNSGTTNPASGSTMYVEGTVVSVTALPDSGWKLSYWLLDNVNVGSANPYSVAMNGNHNLTAVFMVAYLFSDGFESGNFNAWSGTARSSGETTTVVSSPKQDGAYSAMFTSNGGGGYENSYASKTITSINELYARGYFYISQSGIQSNGAHIYLIMLRAGTDNVAFAGWQMTGGVVKWVLMIRSGTGYAGPVFSSASPSMNTWYRVEIHWKLGTSDGSAELYIDGNLNLSITNRNTASYGGVTSVRFGLPELYSCASTIAYADSCVIDDALIGLGSASSQMRPSVQALATDASTVQNSFPDKPSAD